MSFGFDPTKHLTNLINCIESNKTSSNFCSFVVLIVFIFCDFTNKIKVPIDLKFE